MYVAYTSNEFALIICVFNKVYVCRIMITPFNAFNAFAEIIYVYSIKFTCVETRYIAFAIIICVFDKIHVSKHDAIFAEIICVFY